MTNKPERGMKHSTVVKLYTLIGCIRCWSWDNWDNKVPPLVTWPVIEFLRLLSYV